jgi:hypothetical protein
MKPTTKILNAKGYFCERCQTYHAEPLFKMTVEFVGEYHGQPVRVENTEILCPDCRDDEMYEYNPMHWTELKAYLDKFPLPVEFRYPILKERTDLVPLSIARTDLPEVVDTMAKLYDLCVEVLDITYSEDGETAVVVCDFF